MEALSKITTVHEVHEVTPRAQGTDHHIIESLLLQEEEAIFRVWLGLDFYKLLLADLSDNSSATSFLDGTTYATGSKVIFDGLVYEAILETNGSQNPKNKTYWKRASKFNTAAYEYLWQRYLKTIIGWAVFHSGVVYEAIRVTQLGVQRYGDNESFKNRPTTGKELASFKSEIGADVEKFLANMHKYLVDNRTSFTSYKGNSQSSNPVNPGSRKRKNYGFSMH